MTNKETKCWRKVYGTENPYYLFNGKKRLIKNKSNIRDFKAGRQVRICTSISKTMLKNI